VFCPSFFLQFDIFIYDITFIPNFSGAVGIIGAIIICIINSLPFLDSLFISFAAVTASGNLSLFDMIFQ
jgi:hypothetical protein